MRAKADIYFFFLKKFYPLSTINTTNVFLHRDDTNGKGVMQMTYISTNVYYTDVYKTKITYKLINIFIDNLILFFKTRSYYAYLTDPSYYRINITYNSDSELLYIRSFNGPLYHKFQSMLEMQSIDLMHAFDALEEKISVLGLDIPHSFQEFYNLASINQEVRRVSIKEIIENLIHDHMKIIDSMSYLCKTANTIKDTLYKPLLEERIQIHSKHIEKLSKFLTQIATL